MTETKHVTEEKTVTKSVNERGVEITGDDVPAGTDNAQTAPVPDEGTKTNDRPAEGATPNQQERVEQTKED